MSEWTSLALLVVAGAVAFFAPLLAVWRVTRFVRKTWARVYARILILPVIWILSFPAIFEGIARPLEHGDWCCLVCGALESRWCYGNWILSRSASKYDAAEDWHAFRRWHERTIRTTHDHDWVRAGCHDHPANGMVSCSIAIRLTPYFQALPRLPDPAVAESMARRVLGADSTDRNRLICHLWHEEEEGDPISSITAGRMMTREEFDAAYVAWLDRHPEWK